MFILLLRNFLASKVVVIGLLILLLAGITGIYIGNRHLQKQKAAIEKTIRFQQEHIARNATFFNKEMGLLLYYLRFAYINQAPALNGLSIGQRDVNSSIQFVTIRNLESQKYDTDLVNPTNLLAGNLDFSFVLLYLFPLFIIAVTYNLLSEEKEGGTWKLVVTQSKNPVEVLLQKLGIRALVVYAAISFLLLVAGIVLGIPLRPPFWAIIGLAYLYIGFWFVLSFWVVSWQRNSSTNAVSLLGAWILLTIVAPATINNYITNKYPVPEALAMAVANREGFHEKWDMAKQPTLNKFYTHYPQFKKFPLPNKEFSWLWYYAMQQAGDDDAQAQVAKMKQKLQLRNTASNRLTAFLPTLHTQLQLNALAASGLGNQLQFLDSTTAFHEKERLYFYPKIFSETPVNQQNWSNISATYFTENIQPDWLKMYGPTAIITILLGLLCALNFKRRLLWDKA